MYNIVVNECIYPLRTTIMKLAEALNKLIRQDEENYIKMQTWNFKRKMHDLYDVAEGRYLKRPRADYEEVLYIIESIIEEIPRMSYEELKDQCKYVEWLVNVKKKIIL